MSAPKLPPHAPIPPNLNQGWPPIPSHQRFFDFNGDQVTMDRWITLLAVKHADNEEEGRVGLDTVGNITISTVWLGISFHPSGYGNYETLISGGAMSGAIHKYITRQEAEIGHQGWIKAATEIPWLHIERRDDPSYLV